MAEDVSLMDDELKTTTYDNIETLEVDNEEGGTTLYVREDLIEKLPEVTEADNGKVFGVVDGKWQPMDMPSDGGGGSGLPDVTETDNGKFLGVYNGEWGARNVPAPESYPASQVAGLAPVATNGTYDSLYLAPVGPKYVIPPHDATFQRDDNSRWRFSTAAEYAPPVGTECEVTWKGETFIKTLRDCAEVTGLVGEGYGFIGNAYIFTGDTADNTEEEFLFIILHEEYRFVLCYTSYLNAGAIGVSFQIAIPGRVKKLDAKYLPDGIATEEFVRNAVAAGGAETEDILPETVFDGFEYVEAHQAYVYVITAAQLLSEGDECVVSWDGTAYPCIVKSADMDGTAVLFVGNSVLFGEEDTGEPFLIGYGGGELAFFSVTNETSHTVRIYQTKANSFYDEIVEDTVFPESTVPVTWSEADGNYSYTTAITEEMAARLLADNWETATVMWDGTEYTVEKQAIGKLVVFIGGATSSGVPDGTTPFGMICVSAGAMSEQPTAILMDYATPAPAEGANTEVMHSLSVTLNTIVTHKLPDRFQHQPDWGEQDEGKAGYIKNRPFGAELAAGEVVVDVADYYYDPQEFGFLFTDPHTMASDLDKSKVKVGAKYTILAGDYSYTGVGITGEEALSIVESSLPAAECGIRVMDGDTLAGVVVVGLQGVVDILVFHGDDYAARYTNEDGSSNGVGYHVAVTVAEDVLKTIDRKFLPGPPEFDLTAMGLPDVPMDGTVVSVECDTTELMAALGKGPVWYSANYIAGEDVRRATSMSNQVVSDGVYQLTNINYSDGFVLIGIIIVTIGRIEALCKPFTTT